MATVIWTGNAKDDLKEISDYIGLENRVAADRIVDRIYEHVRMLEKHPLSGQIVPDLEQFAYRQLVEPPCRIFYEVRRDKVYILHILRFEQILRLSRLEEGYSN